MKGLKIYALSLFTISNIAFSQVYINVREGEEDPSAMLQVDGDNVGVQFPVIKSTTNQAVSRLLSNPIEGSFFFLKNENNVDPLNLQSKDGFYTFTPQGWNYLGINEMIISLESEDNVYLGYIPRKTNKIDQNSIYNNLMYTYVANSCVKWEDGNKHTYCVYKTNTKTSWVEAFNFAESKEGYLVTITSKAESNFIKNNILGKIPNAEYVAIGYQRYKLNEAPVDIKSSNNKAHRYRWITNENFQISWENSTNLGAIVELNEAFNHDSFGKNVCRNNTCNNSPSEDGKGCAFLLRNTSNTTFGYTIYNEKCKSPKSEYYIIEYP